MLLVEKLKQKKKLSPGEMEIADYILKLGRKLKKYSTRNIADSTFTSPGTVIRLCKKLGYNGYDEFKEQYLREIEYLEKEYGDVDVNFPFKKEDSISQMTTNIGNLYEQTVKDTISIMQYDMLQKAVTLLKSCETLYMFSAGTAINQAETFKEKMMKIGRNIVISNNLSYPLYEANCMSKRDCALIISYSGESKKPLTVAQICKDNGVPIIAFTSFGENTLSKLATCKLLISSRESLFNNIADFSSHLSINLLLDILYGAFFQLNYEKNYNYKLDLVQRMESLRHSDNPLLVKNDES